MIGRGAIGDHKIFERVRQNMPTVPSTEDVQREVTERLRLLLDGYQGIFHGDAQVLIKFKEIVNHIDHPDLTRFTKRLRKAKSCVELRRELDVAW